MSPYRDRATTAAVVGFIAAQENLSVPLFQWRDELCVIYHGENLDGVFDSPLVEGLETLWGDLEWVIEPETIAFVSGGVCRVRLFSHSLGDAGVDLLAHWVGCGGAPQRSVAFYFERRALEVHSLPETCPPRTRSEVNFLLHVLVLHGWAVTAGAPPQEVVAGVCCICGGCGVVRVPACGHAVHPACEKKQCVECASSTRLGRFGGMGLEANAGLLPFFPFLPSSF